MRLAVVSDIHCTERPCKSDVSLEAQAKILRDISVDIENAGCDAILIGGDVYDGQSTSRERRVVWDWLLNLGSYCNMAVIRGNHDDPLDIEALNHISGVTAYTEPGFFNWGMKCGVIPWPAVKLENGAELLAQYVRGMVAEKPDFILGHLDLVDAKFDGGQDSTGKVDSVLTVDDFGGIPTALGHYHKRNGLYVGSIRQMKFGDDAAKGFGIYDTDAASWEWFGPYGRGLVTQDVKWNGEKLVSDDCPEVKEGDLVRLRYDVPESAREAARGCAEIVADTIGIIAANVIVDPTVIADTRTRGAEVASATTPREKLLAFWGDAPPARADEILRKMEAVNA